MKTLFKKIIGILIIISLWEIISILVHSQLFPSPYAVALSMFYLFLEENLLLEFLISLYRVIIGLSLGILLGLVLGILIILFDFIREVVYPVIVFLIVTPSFAFIPLMILWIGLNDWLPISIVIICTGFPIVYAIISSLKNIEPDIIDVALTLGGKKHVIIFKIILPLALTHIFSILKVETSHALRLVFVTEFLAVSSGLGYLMTKAYSLLRVDKILAIIIVLSFTGLLLTYIIEYIESKVMEERGFVRK